MWFFARFSFLCAILHKYTYESRGKGEGELQFVCLIGGRVCNPRQQHTLYICFAKHRIRSLELARNRQYAPFCSVFLLQPYKPLLAWNQQRIVPLRHPFSWQSAYVGPHTVQPFSFFGHWIVSLIWDWECCSCTLAIYSRITISRYQCSLSLPLETMPPLLSQKTSVWDHGVEYYPIHWQDFQRIACISQELWRTFV